MQAGTTPQASKLWTYGRPAGAGCHGADPVALFIALGGPVRGLQVFFWGAHQRRSTPWRTHGQGHATVHRLRWGWRCVSAPTCGTSVPKAVCHGAWWRLAWR